MIYISNLCVCILEICNKNILITRTMYFNYIYQITILKVEKLLISFLVSCVTGGKIVLISKVNFVLLRLKQKKQDMITSVKLMLNKSRILNNGSYPLVFQVIHNRRKKLLYTGYRVKRRCLTAGREDYEWRKFYFYGYRGRENEPRAGRCGIGLIHGSGSLSGQGKNLQWRIFWLKCFWYRKTTVLFIDISMRRLSVSRN